MMRVYVSLAVIMWMAACSSVPPLANTRSTPEELARAVLDGIARRDRAALEALAVSEQEFRDHVWEYLPAARPERNLPFSYVWGDLRQKSAATLTRTLAKHGGRRYELLAVEFAGDTVYGPYRVHRETTLRVRDASAESDIRVLGSVLEKDGDWKVFSYVVDE